ncbi:MAG: PTS sugar transporter subunit IIC [Bulleidia sp.]
MMCNRPLIIGTPVGLVLGDLRTGIIVGSTLELAFPGAVPIGANDLLDMTSGSVIATAFIILSGSDTDMPVTIAIPLVTLVAFFNNLQMMFLLTYDPHRCDKAAEEEDALKVERIVRFVSIGNKIALSLLVALGFYFGSPAIVSFVNLAPEWFSHGMDAVTGILPALGIALLGIAAASLLFFRNQHMFSVGTEETSEDDNEFCNKKRTEQDRVPSDIHSFDDTRLRMEL